MPAPRIWLAAFLAALTVATTRAEPAVEVLVDGVDEASVVLPPARPSKAGVFLLEPNETRLRWFGRRRGVTTFRFAENDLPGQPVAGCGLSEGTQAVILQNDGGASLVLLRTLQSGAVSVLQTVDLPVAGRDPAWSMAANEQLLFVAIGKAVFRSLHTKGGVSVPEPYASFDAPVRSMVFDSKGYLAALVGEGGESEVVFLNPSTRAAEPLARYALPTKDAGRIAYGASSSLAEWPLYVTAGDRLYRIDTVAGPGGRPVAASVMVHQARQPFRSLVGITVQRRTPLGDAGAVIALAGEELLLITPQPLE